ncbi:transcriptional regulator, LysR family [Cystobacter fuscus DSM 2262]|uniref:Transcriptional regulator, LysR family n=2 Tax=Cystobacter fuscus TaxID=43 RepID=S9QAI4_CYSF2|nr:transcriptional regulator, LysR family [Cystobacter fuscus DSM 2262]
MEHMGYTDLDMDLLRSFVTVVDAGGFTAAGAKLGRTQAAMSIRIKRLEELLERRVFDRSSRLPSLTADGELLLSYARQILKLNDETVQRFAEPDSAGELRLGVAEYFVPQHLPGILSRFSQSHPRVHIQVKVGLNDSLFEAQQRGELDVVIALCANPGQGGGRLLRRERLLWVCAREFRVDAAAPVPICTLPPPCIFRARGFEALEALGRAWRVLYTSESIMGVTAAVRAGLGVAALPECCMTESMRTLSVDEGFPELEGIELKLHGENPERGHLMTPLLRFIDESLRPGVRPSMDH